MLNAKTIGSAFVGAMLLGGAPAMAGDLVDYGSVQIASQNVRTGNGYSDLSGSALVLTGGKNMEQLQPGLALEGELTKSVIKPTRTFSGVKVNSDVLSLSGYGVYRWDMSPALDIRLKGGLRYANAKTDVAGGGSSTDSKLGLAFGVGSTYAFNKNSNFRAEYTAISNDVRNISAGVQFKF